MNTARDRFSALVEDALRERWRSLPMLASFSGAPGWDDKLGECSLDAIADGLREKKRLLSRARALRPADEEQRLDLRVLAGHLRCQIAELEQWRRAEWDASLYPLTVVRSCHILTIREDLDAAYRRHCLASRLRQAPAFLAQGLRNLRRPDGLHVELALHACAGALAFLREAIERADPRGAELVSRALRGYAAAVRELRPQAGLRWPIGRELFELKLREEHGVAGGVDFLAESGRQAVADTLRSLEAISKNWRGELKKLKKDHPSAAGLLPAYRAETRRARQFCLDRGLVTFPKGERLDVVATPRFERATTPYAALLAPPPLGRSGRGYFWVTPSNLEGHCRPGLPSVCPHEAYPGHHLQYARMQRLRSKVRRIYTTPVLIEGWALYCEQMMEEQGYFPDEGSKLYRLKDQLWRAVRIGVDLGLHVRRWSHARAARELVRSALLEPDNAAVEVNRYCGGPTQPMSYMTGKLQLLALRERCRRAWGPRFSLRRFHDAVLDCGGMPPSWMPLP